MTARPIAIADLHELARRRLPRAVLDFIDGGSGDERTLRENTLAMGDWSLVPRVGIDVSRRDTRTSLLGRESRLPLFLSPTGLAGFFGHKERSQPQGQIGRASC